MKKIKINIRPRIENVVELTVEEKALMSLNRKTQEGVL